MGANLQDLKTELRKEAKTRMSGLSAESRFKSSASARALLEQQQTWMRAQSVLFYAPSQTELDIWPTLISSVKTGKLVALPWYDPEAKQYVARQVKNPSEEVARGNYGIREPMTWCDLVPLNRLDFVLVPGVAFDLHGRRLGRGKGFYDRLLAAVRAKTCGVAFDEQIVREVPVEAHDSDVNCILTPTRWIEL